MYGSAQGHGRCIVGNINFGWKSRFGLEGELDVIGRQHELEAYLLRPHGHCQRPLSAVFYQTDPLNPHFLLLTTEAEGILLDH